MNDFWDKLDPGFFEPVWLIVGLLAVIAVVLLEIGAERRRRQALRLFAAPHLISALTVSVSPVKRFWKKALLVAAVALLFIALARPHLFYQWQEEERRGIDLLVAIDTSKSMLTEDVKPNRLERAKLAIADFAEGVPNDRLGLIVFAGDAFLQVPLTLDHDAFQTAVRELDTRTIPRPGTDIAVAIDQAVVALKSQSANTKILLLVTDGEDLEGRAIAAAKNAAQAGLKIYTVGVGTPEGDLIPEREESGAAMYLHDNNGQIVKSRLDESALREIASSTGGAYARMGQRGEGLEEIYRRYIEPLPRKHQETRREKVRFERYEWPLGAAILFLIASMLINERTASPGRNGASQPRRKLPSVPATIAGLALLAALSPVHAATADKAERDYKSGHYADAAQNYKKAVETQPRRDDLKYNLGDAAYKAGQFSQAEEAFRKSLETPDLGLQEKTYYNLGNTQFRHGEAMQKDDQKKTIDLWEHALKSYDASMKLKNSADARHNYEFVKQKLEQLKQQQQQQQEQQQKNQDDKSKQDQKKDSKSQNGQGSNQNQSPQDSDKPKDGESSQSQQGQNQQPNAQPSPEKQEQKDEPKSPSDANAPMNGRSEGREKDQNDPGIKSSHEAEALLDSLKDDEKHVNARTLNGNGNEPPPAPPSGKEW